MNTQPDTKPKPSWVRILSFLGASYGVLLMFPLLSIPVAVILVVYATNRSKSAARFCAVLAPPIVFTGYYFADGAMDYVTGKGRLIDIGLYDVEHSNLDPEYHCYRVSHCVVTGLEPFTDAPHNLAIKVLTKTFGPMEGTYHGPYPTREEAFQLLADSKKSLPTYVEGFRTHRELTKTTNFFRAFAPEIGLPESTEYDKISYSSFVEDYRERIKYAVYKDETIIIGSPRYAVLVAKKSGEVYATYRHPPPPVEPELEPEPVSRWTNRTL